MITSAVSSSPARRRVRATTGAAPAIRLHAPCLGVLLAAIACLVPTAPVRAQHPALPGVSAHGAAQTRAADDASIRPFHIHVPEEALVDLRRRLAATRWPSRETVALAQTAMLPGLAYTSLRDAILAHPTMAEALDLLFSNVPLRSG